jgi:release factor glutamine methyltransferase
MEKLRILDIGTGSERLTLPLLLVPTQSAPVPTSACIFASARANAAHCGLEARCNFVACDMAAGVQGPFDMVVSNPPYVAHGEIASLAPEVREYDPAIALDGGHDGLDAYRAIIAQAKYRLVPGGRLFVELGAGQEAAVRALFTNAGLTVDTARKDLAGILRVLGAVVAL